MATPKEKFAIKKSFMKHMWRLQQTYAVFSIVFWGTTLTLLLWNFIKWPLLELSTQLGVETQSAKTALGLIILFFIIIIVILIFGYIYDRVLRLWKEQNIVIVERSPYSREYMCAKEIVHFQWMYIPMLRALGKNEEADFYEKWNERLVEEDVNLRAECYRLINWVNEYQLKEKRWLEDFRKKYRIEGIPEYLKEELHKPKK